MVFDQDECESFNNGIQILKVQLQQKEFFENELISTYQKTKDNNQVAIFT